VEIQAVYTIGSLGSVAQDPASDLDYWVCASLSALPPEKRGLLQRKLEAIEGWAGQRFGLEVHFFLMDVEDVRRNNFGFSDEESSGSAQALMLKEEFYRTAMLAAGRPPLWWMVPGGASERAYELTRARVRALLGEGACVDLGHAGRIPEAEFFGASLWQIVKGLKSPFKSVMKFALLERYIRGGGDAPLLCDRIKANLAAGRTRLWEADPYVLLYHEVIAHYRRMNDAPAMELITLAFLLKSGLTTAGEDAPTPCRAEERDLPDLLAQVAAQTPGGREGLPSSAGATYEGVLALGARVNQFLVATYNSVRDSMPAGAKALITPEDLTKLGRKIFTTFAKRPNKVEHISFLEAMQARLGEILFTAAASKAGRVWKLEAGVLDQSSGRVLYTPLKQGRGLAALLAWAAMNGLSRGGAPVRADLSVSPLTAQDLGEAMAALAAFFAPVLAHEDSIGESLKAERVTRAFFLLNLTAPRESAARAEGQVVYATNWGEIFCVDVPVARPEFAAVPASFLREVLNLEAPEEVELGVFVPARSQCPAPEWSRPAPPRGQRP
jgi:adenylate cyclase class 1